MASMYAVYHGPDGLAAIAGRVARYAAVLAAALRDGGVDGGARGVLRHVARPRARPRRPRWCAPHASAESTCGWSTTTTSASAPMRRRLASSSRPCSPRSAWPRRISTPSRTGWETTRTGLPASLLRASDYLTHPVFHAHRSETAMLRYLRRLADRDYALDRGMIPLGSCTMKLNATTEMEPITWPEFADLHPFAPLRADRGDPRADRRPVDLAGRDHRLRRGLAAAERRVAGRAGRAARDPRLPPGQRPGRPRGSA